MIVFNENTIGQAHAVVGCTAHAHGVFFQNPPARGGFARVQNHTRQVVHHPAEFFSLRGNAAQPLQEIEGCPFTRQERPHGAKYARQSVTRFDATAFRGSDFHFDPFIDQFEDRGQQWQSGNAAIHPAVEPSLACQIFRYQGEASRVASAAIGRDEVFIQSGLGQNTHSLVFFSAPRARTGGISHG